MTWKTGANAPLGLLPVNPTTPDAAITTGTPVGTIRQFIDETQGPAEMIYLPGVASTVAGDLVSYNLLPSGPTTTRLLAAAAAASGLPVAVALGASVAGKYGWYQISGVAIVNIAGSGAVGPLYATATAGSGSSTQGSGHQINSARIVAAVGTPAAGQSYVQINRPACQTQAL